MFQQRAKKYKGVFLKSQRSNELKLYLVASSNPDLPSETTTHNSVILDSKRVCSFTKQWLLEWGVKQVQVLK